MTIAEAHRLFRFSLDKMDGLNYPGFQPEEIDLLLNQAQDRYIKQRYSGNNYKRTSVEEDQKRMEDLKNVIKERTSAINTLKENNVNAAIYTITLPADHWFLIYERGILDCPGCNQTITYKYNDGFISTMTSISGTYVDVIPTTHVELNNTLKDEFNKPDKTRILRLEAEGKVELILPTTCTGMFYIARYIKKPERVSLTGGVTFELSDHTHEEIVMEAVKIALEGIEAKRTGTFTPIIDNQKE